MKVLVLGSGQLARMMSLASAPLNIDIIAYDVNNNKIVHPLTQQVMDTTLEQTINSVDVITAEFEHIPYDILDICSQSGKFQPTPKPLKLAAIVVLRKHYLIMPMWPMQHTI